MALVLADRVKETSTTTGTGTYTLAGAVSGFESFGSIGNGNTTYYACTLGADFEVGIGTYTSSGTTLARTTILQSSNSDNAVSWGSGTKTLFCTQPAEKAVFLNASDNIELADNEKIILGTGSDLEIYHSGSGSIIEDTGTGPLQIKSNNLQLLAGNDEQMASFVQDGAVTLRHNSSTKLETTSSGVTITGTLEANAHRFGDTHVKRISVDYTGGGDYLVDNEFQEILSITPDGNSENYSIVGRIMATSGANVHTLDINVALRSNTLPDLSYSGSYISTITGTIEYLTPRMWVKETSTASFKLVIEVNAQIYGRLNADVEIIARNESDLDNITVNTTEDSEVTSVTTGFTQYSVTKVYETDDGAFAFTDDVTLTGASYNVLWDKSANALEFADNAKSIFGTGNDLQIYHDGSNSYISETGTGHLIINSTGSNLYLRTNTTENSIVGINNGAVELYHDNSKKLETTSSGATVTGDLQITGALTSVGDVTIGANSTPAINMQPTNDAQQARVFFKNTAGTTESIFRYDYTNNQLQYYDMLNSFEVFHFGSDGQHQLNGDLTLTSTDDGATENPTLDLYRNSASPADGDVLGHIDFSGEDSAGNKTVYAKINADAIDVTDGTEDGRLDLGVVAGGSMQNRIIMKGNGVTTFVNKDIEISSGLNIRFEGSTADTNETSLTVTDPTADRTITLPDSSGTVLTTGNSNTPTTTTSSGDADFVLVDDGGTMKKITPSNLGITSGGTTAAFATAMAMVL